MFPVERLRGAYSTAGAVSIDGCPGFPPEVTDAAETAGLRSNIYAFLAVVYQREPDMGLLARLASTDCQAALASVGVNLGSELTSRPRQDVCHELAVEYTRLFIGPGKHISPHESVYVQGNEGGIWGESTAEVKHFIEAIGFRFRTEYPVIPDHIGVELEFMQGMARYEADEWSAGNGEAACYCLDVQERFLNRHLARWVPGFCEKIITETTSPFYREMAGLTRDFILHEVQEIRARITRLAK